jgi:DNA-binding transcriptional LysR family regulator
MSSSEPRGLDIRLLRILQLLLKERSVSRVAERLGQTQPAVSATLRQLREIFGDPILVRSGNSLTPTARAIEMAATVDTALANFDKLVTSRDEIQPEIACRLVRIVTSNGLAMLLVPRLVELLRKKAPGLDLEISTLPADGSLERGLESGEINLVIGIWPAPANDLRLAPLFEADIVCMVRPSHPLATQARIDLRTYLAQSHISPTSPSISQLSPIDGRLAQLKLNRRISVTVPEYFMIPYVLASDDLVLTTARPFAEHVTSFMPFATIEAPPELGSMKFSMLWHERAHASAFERWLRDMVRRVAKEIRTVDAPKPFHKPSAIPPISTEQMAAPSRPRLY